MRRNPKLEELPDHGHYVECAMCKDAIDKRAGRLFTFVAGSGAVLAFMTALTIPLGSISWFPSLFGESATINYLLVQWFEIFLMTAAAFLNYIRFRFLGTAFTVIYAVMLVAAIITGADSGANPLMIIIGGVGLLLSWHCYFDYFDDKQLRETEGYPHFNHLLVDPPEGRGYKPRYAEEYRRPTAAPKPSMAGPTPIFSKTSAKDFAKAVERERRILEEAKGSADYKSVAGSAAARMGVPTSSTKRSSTAGTRRDKYGIPTSPLDAIAEEAKRARSTYGGTVKPAGLSELEMPGLEGISESMPEKPEVFFFDPMSSTLSFTPLQ